MNHSFHAAALIALLWIALPGSAIAQPELPMADSEKLQASIDALSEFGANEDGGIDRVAYSQADLDARQWVMDQLAALNLKDIRVDAGGNILARRPGTDRDAKPVMFGSHIDSVLGGGNYDGQAGVVTALEAMRLLNAAEIETRSDFYIIIFSNEEGGLIGSLALTGHLQPGALDVKSDSGLTIGEGIRAIGGNPDFLADDIIPNDALKAFIELHIEQGGLLDASDTDIGVVEGIVGIEWWDITLLGTANHAGTTPMDQRNDAMLAAAELTLAINEVANTLPGRQVATVGRISAFPGAPNVIPGRVEMSLEVRDLESAKIEEVYELIQSRAETISEARDISIHFERLDVASSPALTDPAIREIIGSSAEALNLSYSTMPSGAGHDAQDMARIAPTGMIFVPSKDGISHSPAEFTSADDLANGANVLLRTLLSIDADDS